MSSLNSELQRYTDAIKAHQAMLQFSIAMNSHITMFYFKISILVQACAIPGQNFDHTRFEEESKKLLDELLSQFVKIVNEPLAEVLGNKP